MKVTQYEVRKVEFTLVLDRDELLHVFAALGATSHNQRIEELDGSGLTLSSTHGSVGQDVYSNIAAELGV